MAISYNKLWKLLVDKKMSKADLRKAAGIPPQPGHGVRRDACRFAQISLAHLFIDKQFPELVI